MSFRAPVRYLQGLRMAITAEFNHDLWGLAQALHHLPHKSGFWCFIYMIPVSSFSISYYHFRNFQRCASWSSTACQRGRSCCKVLGRQNRHETVIPGHLSVEDPREAEQPLIQLSCFTAKHRQRSPSHPFHLPGSIGDQHHK